MSRYIVDARDCYECGLSLYSGERCWHPLNGRLPRTLPVRGKLPPSWCPLRLADLVLRLEASSDARSIGESSLLADTRETTNPGLPDQAVTLSETITPAEVLRKLGPYLRTEDD